MGPEAKVLYFAIKISFMAILNCRFKLKCLSSTEHFRPFLLKAITCNRPGIAEA
jgi:hypothetical protein